MKIFSITELTSQGNFSLLEDIFFFWSRNLTVDGCRQYEGWSAGDQALFIDVGEKS